MTRPLFIQAKSHRFSCLALLTSLLAFAWVLFGAYLQTTGAAAACPDWPRCFGFFSTPHTASQIQLALERFPNTAFHSHEAWLEVSYRYLSAAVLTGIILLTIAATTLWDESPKRSLFICLCLLLLCSADITLRLHSVMQNQQPLFQFSHGLIAFAIMGLLWWLSRITHTDTAATYHQPQKNIKPWAWLSLVLVFVIALSLSLNAACTRFAFCTNIVATLLHLNVNSHTVLNTLLSQQTLTVLTYFSLGYLCLFSLLLLFNRQINHLAFLLLVLVTAKILFVSLATTETDFTWSILYQTAIVAFLLMTMISLLTQVYRKPHHYWSR